jgi:hypothetical protein
MKNNDTKKWRVKDFLLGVLREQPLIFDKPSIQIPCSIRKNIQLQNINQKPIIHKNTFAQLLYEAFYTGLRQNNKVIPIIIILKTNVIKGINIPGYYSLDKEENQFSCLKIIDVDDKFTNRILKTRKERTSDSCLAIAYTTNIKNLQDEVKQYNVLEEAQDFLDGIDTMLGIHGELTSYVTSNLDEDSVIVFQDIYQNRLPLLYTQWLKQI